LASAAAEPAFAADTQEAKYSASNLDFFDSRLQINEWGAVSSIPNNDPAPHLRVGTDSTATQTFSDSCGKCTDCQSNISNIQLGAKALLEPDNARMMKRQACP
jgi:hypothetical protein